MLQNVKLTFYWNHYICIGSLVQQNYFYIDFTAFQTNMFDDQQLHLGIKYTHKLYNCIFKLTSISLYIQSFRIDIVVLFQHFLLLCAEQTERFINIRKEGLLY